MIIEKVLNNNVVVIIDPKTKKEVILMGKGVAFNKKAGEKVDKDRIEKTFIIDENNVGSNMKKLINHIPDEIIQITHEIISFASKSLKKKLDDHIYVSLSDHISFAVKRYKNGVIIKNELLEEIRRIHKDEYRVALKSLQYINKKLKINLPEDEAGFIALHILNSTYDNSGGSSIQSTNIIKGILEVIKSYYEVEFEEDEINYHRLLTHLKYFAKRVVLKKQHKDESSELIDLISEKYKDAHNCALEIKKYMNNNFKYNVSNDEIVYLTLHIHRVINALEE